jgi:hypothetical protein
MIGQSCPAILSGPGMRSPPGGFGQFAWAAEMFKNHREV